MSDNLRDFYRDDYVAIYENKPISRLSRLSDHIELNGNEVVVDYACGNAMMLSIVHDNVREYHGVDFSEEMIDAAKKRALQLGFEGAYFYTEDIIEFAEKNVEKFDVAFAMDFSEHVYDKDWLKILRAMKKSLKKGGVLYMHTPNADYIIEILKDKGVLKQFPEHVAVRNAKDNMELLRQAGYEDVTLKYLQHYEVRQKWMHLFSRLPIIGKYFRARLFISAE